MRQVFERALPRQAPTRPNVAVQVGRHADPGGSGPADASLRHEPSGFRSAVFERIGDYQDGVRRCCDVRNHPGVSLMGSYGYTSEIAKFMRDAKIMQVYEGTNQIQRLVISRAVLSPAPAQAAGKKAA